MRRLVSCIALVSLLAISAAVPARASEETTIGEGASEESAVGLAGVEGLPDEFWYFPEDVRLRMAADPNVVPMYEAAVRAKHRRKTAGNVMFIIGAPIVLASFVIWVAPHDLGIHDLNTAELIGYVGATSGTLGFVLPGALLRGIRSGAERRFIRYVKETYDVIPVVELPYVRPDGVWAWNLLHLEF